MDSHSYLHHLQLLSSPVFSLPFKAAAKALKSGMNPKPKKKAKAKKDRQEDEGEQIVPAE